MRNVRQYEFRARFFYFSRKSARERKISLVDLKMSVLTLPAIVNALRRLNRNLILYNNNKQMLFLFSQVVEFNGYLLNMRDIYVCDCACAWSNTYRNIACIHTHTRICN